MQQSVPKQYASLSSPNSFGPNHGRFVYGMSHYVHVPYGGSPYHYANPYHYHPQYNVYPHPPMMDPSAIYQQQEALYGQFPATMEQLHQLRLQVEFYFSFENLVGDKYLLKQMDDHKGMVPCYVVANFRRVVAIMGGVPASNQLLTLALLHSNIVRVLFGQYLVPSAGVFSRVLETRGRSMQSTLPQDDATAATVSSFSSSRHSKDDEHPPLDNLDSQATSLADPEDNAELCAPQEESFLENQEKDVFEEHGSNPQPKGRKQTEQCDLEEENRSIDEDNSKLLRGILGLNINDQDVH